MKLQFHDASIMFGEPLKPAPFNTATPDAARAMLDHFGIAKALVRLTEQEGLSETGNSAAASFAAGQSRLRALWYYLPHTTGEFPKPAELAGAMKRSNIAGIYIDPSKTYSIRKTFIGDTLSACEDNRIPVFIPCPNYPAYEKADELLSDFPQLTFIACNGNSWGLERYTWPLFERYERFNLCLGQNRVSGSIQETAKRFGASRLLFGSNYPAVTPGGACELIRRLDIDDASKEQIAHGTLDRILSEVRL
ncbi:MAG: amidohydrolase family protein [Spirochaetes bacterium]|nr:amidohydrolase family protein [Spirochaetota bacterium]